MSKESPVVVGYVRVSTENQLENYSIEEQIERLKSYCAAKGWTLRKVYTDGGYSGGNTNRPALQQMLQAIRAGGLDAVVVYKLDRLSRSQKDTLTLIEDELLSNGTDFVSINENFDTSTPFGRAMIGMLSVFAQLEKDQITERFTMGRIGRGKAGYFHGGGNAPTGYDYRDGLLVVNEYEAMQVREIFHEFLSGKSINSIQRNLAARYTTKWSAAKIRNILTNNLYIGKVHFYKQDYDGLHQPIIDQATFFAAQRLLKSPEREAKKTTRQKTPFRANYLLSSLVYCARCGARYSANHGYYKCYSRAKSSPKFVTDPNCRNDNWLIEDLNAVVCAEVNLAVSNTENLQKIIAQASKGNDNSVNKNALEKRIAELESQTSKLIDLYQIGSIPIEQITERISAISQERETLMNSLSESCTPPSTKPFLDAVEAYKSGFNNSDLDSQRLFLSSLIERITIDGKSVSIHWRI